MSIQIQYQSQESKARTGIVRLPHGDVTVPAFMPVGTNGSVKAIHHETVDKIGYRMILGNTYHLYLRPRIDVIKHFGGLHQFSNWKHNILTDSGGFQIFSLAPFRKIRKEGIRFRSHIDGAYHNLTPELVVELQESLGSDIMMQLDVCTDPDVGYKKALDAVIRTTDWARRSKIRWEQSSDDYQGLLFGIIQGNFYEDLRKRSAYELLELDFPGYAIGGLSVGETFQEYSDYLSYTAQFLPEDKPRYVMGIGTPEFIFEAVENGIDMFDCVFPTRIARNGAVFTDEGILPLKKVSFEFDERPIVEDCPCTACQKYSRAYMRHMVKANEIFGAMLATEHNLTYLFNFMEKIRQSIQSENFLQFKKDYLTKYLNQ